MSFKLLKGLVKGQIYIYSFHLVVLYENYLIFIFMSINENLKMRTKPQSEGQPYPRRQSPITLKCDLDLEFA